MLGIALALLAAHVPSSEAAPPGFVVADGASFATSTETGPAPWAPVGYNQYRLTSRPGGYVCDGGYGAVSNRELGKWLDRIRASGANVVRTWFFQSFYDGDGDGPGGGSWTAFDRLVKAAAARDLRVIPVLVNHWSDCEPAGETKDIRFYSNGFRRDASYGYALSFERFAQMVAARYRDNPTIAFWQLVNEAEAPGPGGCDEDAASEALREFGAEMTQALHSADPNHLVSLGTMGSGQCGTAGANYESVHEPVDICEVHEYDYRYSTADDPGTLIPGDEWNGVSVRIEQCGEDGLGKPLFIGEIGLAADLGPAARGGGGITPASLASRAGYIDDMLDAQFEAGVDGAVLWEAIREPSASAFNRLQSEPFGVGPGDPLDDVVRTHAT